ncbi:hypothetical protein BKA56DRAFT_499532, partial [Ilyonectria sp. MPI-CAGE-AT-0026]
RDIELKHDFDNYCKMLEMLDEPTVNGFAALPKDTRRNGFRKCLVENELIEFDGFVEWQHCKAIYTFLLFKEHLEGNEIGQQLIQEARQIFYEENSFMLSSTLLQWFLSDPLGGWEKSTPVKSLVRDITIRVDRRHCRGEDMVPSLQEAFQFTDLERVSIEILDRGVPDGSDLATQETIKKITRVVKDLIGRFDERLQVLKALFLDDDFKNGLTLCPAVHHDASRTVVHLPRSQEEGCGKARPRSKRSCRSR